MDLELARARAKAKLRLRQIQAQQTQTEQPANRIPLSEMNVEPDAPKRLIPDEDPSLLGELEKSYHSLEAGVARTALPFADEAVGAIGGVASKLQGKPFSEGYNRTRDLYNENLEDKTSEYPVPAVAGSLLGAAGVGLATGGASLPTQMAVSAGLGASTGEGLERVGNAALGAGLTGAAGAFGRAAPIQTTENLANSTARRALGFNKGMIKQAGGVDKADDIAQTLRTNGLFDKGVSQDAIEESVGAISQRANQNLDRLYQTLDESGAAVPNLGNLANRVVGVVRKYQGLQAQAGELNDLMKATTDLQTLLQKNGNSFSTLRSMKQYVGDLINKRETIANKVPHLRELYGALAQEIDEAATTVGGDVGRQLLDANKLASTAIRAEPALADRAAAQAGNMAFGLRESILSGTGATVGTAVAGPVGGFVGAGLGGAASIASKKYGMGAAGWSANKLDQIVKSVVSSMPEFTKYAGMFQEAAKKGATSVSALTYSLMQKDPEFNKAVMEGQKDVVGQE